MGKPWPPGPIIFFTTTTLYKKNCFVYPRPTIFLVLNHSQRFITMQNCFFAFGTNLPPIMLPISRLSRPSATFFDFDNIFTVCCYKESIYLSCKCFQIKAANEKFLQMTIIGHKTQIPNLTRGRFLSDHYLMASYLHIVL